jgi:hypothetical protein
MFNHKLYHLLLYDTKYCPCSANKLSSHFVLRGGVVLHFMLMTLSCKHQNELRIVFLNTPQKKEAG